jgi:uncharacterized protein YcfL
MLRKFHGLFDGMRSKRSLFILSAVIFGLLACSSTPTVDEMTARTRDTKDVKITDMRSIVAGGLLTAQVSIKNKGAKKPVYYRFLWKDKSGLQVGGDEAWKPMTIGTDQSGIISGIAPHPSATDFKFELTSD